MEKAGVLIVLASILVEKLVHKHMLIAVSLSLLHKRENYTHLQMILYDIVEELIND